MDRIREDAEGGVNALIKEQAKQSGEALLSLVQFDTEYEFVHRGLPIQRVPPYTLVPRGSRALLDAVGRAINETGERLAKMAEADRTPSVGAHAADGFAATPSRERRSRGRTNCEKAAAEGQAERLWAA